MLLTGSPSDMRQSRELDALTKKLGELGWVEGRTLGVETRWAKTTDSLPGLAADLVRLGVDIILTPGPEATNAVRTATSAIPIVMIASTDPRAVGAAGLARPGGNVTGLTIGQFELVMEKRLELLKETLPGVRHVAILWGVGTADRTAPLSAAARTLKLQLQHLDVTNADFDGAFTTAKKAGWRRHAGGKSSHGREPGAHRRAWAQAPAAGDEPVQSTGRGGRVDVIRARLERPIWSCRLLHRQDLEGR